MIYIYVAIALLVGMCIGSGVTIWLGRKKKMFGTIIVEDTEETLYYRLEFDDEDPYNLQNVKKATFKVERLNRD